ncbi:hypothetical protein [Brevibacillus agri]|uniref:hypothetical protein n=1 Tax=Brevibacillus agri TaxID=51101 RepID=UPI003D22D65A
MMSLSPFCMPLREKQLPCQAEKSGCQFRSATCGKNDLPPNSGKPFLTFLSHFPQHSLFRPKATVYIRCLIIIQIKLAHLIHYQIKTHTLPLSTHPLTWLAEKTTNDCRFLLVIWPSVNQKCFMFKIIR